MPVVSKPKGKSPLVKAVKKATQKREPLWKGPEIDGVTQSLISSFLSCRERFRVKYIEGLRPIEQFNKFLEYGNMWHICEEEYAARPSLITETWREKLKQYAQKLCQRFPLAQGEIEKWYNCCRVQFPVYVDHWAKHPDVEARTPLMQEYVFDVPYQLPSGRVVRLRGKFDSVDLIGRGKNAGIYLQENKTKGDIDEQQLQRQLSFDMQTMIYLVALQTIQETYSEGKQDFCKDFFKTPIRGVRYNVIRRPLSGGKGSIKMLEAKGNRPAETPEEYYNRLQQYFIEEPNYWFMRWKAEVSQADVERFKQRFLNPILEQLCDWYSWITSEMPGAILFGGPHWQHPFGAVNGINEYGHSDLDEYLLTGSEVGLKRSENLFTELQ